MTFLFYKNIYCGLTPSKILCGEKKMNYYIIPKSYNLHGQTIIVTMGNYKLIKHTIC